MEMRVAFKTLPRRRSACPPCCARCPDGGALHIRPRYLTRALPWLLRFTRETTERRARYNARAERTQSKLGNRHGGAGTLGGGVKQPKPAETGMARSETPRLLLGVREPGLTAEASCQEVALICVGSNLTSLHTPTTDVLPSNSARRSQARWRGALPGSPISGQEEGDVGHSCFNHHQWR
jgi:hypothetical protein